eukprot:1060603-Rhodomonas_salina.2
MGMLLPGEIIASEDDESHAMYIVEHGYYPPHGIITAPCAMYSARRQSTTYVVAQGNQFHVHVGEFRRVHCRARRA